MPDVAKKLQLVVPSEAKGERLDRFLATQVAELSRNAAAHLVRRGRVRVGGAKTKAHYKLKGG